MIAVAAEVEHQVGELASALAAAPKVGEERVDDEVGPELGEPSLGLRAGIAQVGEHRLDLRWQL